MKKTCSKCQCEKYLDKFSREKKSSDGYSYWCLECHRAKNKERYEADKARRLAKQKAYATANPDKVKANNRRQYEENREERIAYTLAQIAKNPERKRAYNRQAYLNNPDYYATKSIWRHEAIKRATPPWVDRDAIAAIYAESRRITAETGVPHEVDHIHPLQSDVLCGLHVPWNLEVKTQEANRRKGNTIMEIAA